MVVLVLFNYPPTLLWCGAPLECADPQPNMLRNIKLAYLFGNLFKYSFPTGFFVQCRRLAAEPESNDVPSFFWSLVDFVWSHGFSRAYYQTKSVSPTGTKGANESTRIKTNENQPDTIRDLCLVWMAIAVLRLFGSPTGLLCFAGYFLCDLQKFTWHLVRSQSMRFLAGGLCQAVSGYVQQCLAPVDRRWAQIMKIEKRACSAVTQKKRENGRRYCECFVSRYRNRASLTNHNDCTYL